MTSITRHERGWAAHYIGSSDCRFRRNTLLRRDGEPWVIVSTVGAKWVWTKDDDGEESLEMQEIGYARFYETFVLRAGTEPPYFDAGEGVPWESYDEWGSVDKETGEPITSDEDANEFHEKITLLWMELGSEGFVADERGTRSLVRPMPPSRGEGTDDRKEGGG